MLFVRFATPLGTYMYTHLVYTSVHVVHFTISWHMTRVRAADMPATREKMYTIVHVCTQKHAAGGGN